MLIQNIIKSMKPNRYTCISLEFSRQVKENVHIAMQNNYKNEIFFRFILFSFELIWLAFVVERVIFQTSML